MSQPNEGNASTPARRDPRTDDLKDWAAIGMIIVASSFLLWAPLFI